MLLALSVIGLVIKALRFLLIVALVIAVLAAMAGALRPQGALTHVSRRRRTLSTWARWARATWPGPR